MAIKSRKGVVYVFVTTMFLIVFLVLFITHNKYSHSDSQNLVLSRVMTMNDFIVNLHQDLDRAAYISGFRALLALEQHVSSRGEFFENQQNMQAYFVEAFSQGTINNTLAPIMDNSTFNEYVLRVSAQSTRIGMHTNITILNVTLFHLDPWTVAVRLLGRFNISDNTQAAYWYYERNFTTSIPIQGLRDPLYSVNTLGRVPNIVRNYSVDTSWYVNDTTNSTFYLQVYVNGSFYRESNLAPNFLMRFTNDLSAHPLGIESIIDFIRIKQGSETVEGQAYPVFSDRSMIDHIYFSRTPDTSNDHCSIQNMLYFPDWFRLDDEHFQAFGMSELNSINPCP